MHACAKGPGVSSLIQIELFEVMENPLVKLAAALRERLAIIGDKNSRIDSAAHMSRLQSISEKIDTLQGALPGTIDPQLAHYLQRRSYDKALDFIENTIRQSTAR